MFRGFRLPKEWTTFQDTVLIRKYGEIANKENVKIAGFDFDDTLIKRHNDVQAFPTVLSKLKTLHDEGYVLAIFSNETIEHLKNPVNTLKKKTDRLETFVQRLNLPIFVIVATKYDEYRKPSTKDAEKKKFGGNRMWTKFIELYNFKSVDMENSFYVGDAAGRRGEFSDADKAFAECVGVKFIHALDYFNKVSSSSSSSKTTTTITTTLKIERKVLEEGITPITEFQDATKMTTTTATKTTNIDKRKVQGITPINELQDTVELTMMTKEKSTKQEILEKRRFMESKEEVLVIIEDDQEEEQSKKKLKIENS